MCTELATRTGKTEEVDRCKRKRKSKTVKDCWERGIGEARPDKCEWGTSRRVGSRYACGSRLCVVVVQQRQQQLVVVNGGWS